MACTHNRSGAPHVRQENRKARRIRRASERAEVTSKLTPAERAAKAQKHRAEYLAG